MVKIWLLQNGIAFWGIKVQIVPYHFVSKQIPCAHPFCRLFSMPPILCLEKAGSDPMGLISTGINMCKAMAPDVSQQKGGSFESSFGFRLPGIVLAQFATDVV